ncbi:MAG: hypothetical protein QG656_936 [Candidatus Hydrogenedentes bacterium]|nr:hypothetical protein [Candidatus Hydrogenedentota bacterium]
MTLVVWLAGAAEQPPVLGGNGATLSDVAGTSTLVTLVLKETNAQDRNLRVTKVYEDHFTVVSEDNVPSAYMFNAIKEIRVQGGVIETKEFLIDEAHALRAEEQKVVDRAYARAGEIFRSGDKDQKIKMQAAVLLCINRDHEAREYLDTLLAAENDLMTQLDALLHLYLVGDAAVDKALLQTGLESGNRKAKAKAAQLAGLLKDRSNEGYLTTMLLERPEDLSCPAARALARLGNRDCIPTLLRMITELSPEKGNAAIYALSTLGGYDVADQMKIKYNTAVGEMRFRIARVLFNVGDSLGRKLMIEEFMQIPTIAPEAAMVLAREGDWDAMQLLRDRLARRFDPMEEILKSRAEYAGALIEGGDAGPTAELQELLRSDKESIPIYICQLIARLGKRQLLTITQPPIESSKADLSIEACYAAVAIANPGDFRARLAGFRD